MERSSTDKARRRADGCRFPPHPSAEVDARRFAPDKSALRDALQVVRGLDADSYQALLWALGLTPDPRLSVPGAGRSTSGDRPA